MCQGAAAKDWLAAREADLLPVPYFHVVFTLPAAIRPRRQQFCRRVKPPLSNYWQYRRSITNARRQCVRVPDG
jgi:hypothetical protein